MSKKSFSTGTKYISAVPRSQRRKGGASPSYGVSTKGGVDSSMFASVVDLLSDQDITGIKNFINGLKVGGALLRYDADKKTWFLSGNLVVEKDIAWNSSIEGFVPKTITDAVMIDGVSIKRRDDGTLYAEVGSGGIDENYLANYLANNRYATQDWVNERGYLTGDTLRNYTFIWSENTDLSTIFDAVLSGGRYIGAPDGLEYGAVLTLPYRKVSGNALQDFATQIYIPNADYVDYSIRWRGSISNDWGGWRKLLDTANYSDYALPITGGEMEGDITLPSGKYVRTGGDSNYAMLGIDNGTMLVGSPEFPLTIRSNGSTSVNGSISGATSIHFVDNTSSNYGIYAGNYYFDTYTKNDLALNFTKVGIVGSLAVGGEATDAKLHIHGTALVEDYIRADGFNIKSGASSVVGLMPNYKITSGGNQYDIWLYNYGYDIHYDASQHIFEGFTTLQDTLINSVKFQYTDEINRYGGDLFIQHRGASSPTFEGTTGNVYMCVNGGSVGIGGRPANSSAKLHIFGNVIATGEISWNSSLVLKDVIGERFLSLDDLKKLKPYNYYWKDGRDDKLHAGAVADYVLPILPEVILTDRNNIHSMDYGQGAWVVGTSLVPIVDKHENEIIKLKRIVKELEKKQND